jgi:hypothetical protein
MAKDKQVEASGRRHMATFHLPFDHKPGMKVPKGGSSCAKCEYLGKDKKTCTNTYFIEWHGGDKLPAPADEYCSDWFEGK